MIPILSTSRDGVVVLVAGIYIYIIVGGRPSTALSSSAATWLRGESTPPSPAAAAP